MVTTELIKAIQNGEYDERFSRIYTDIDSAKERFTAAVGEFEKLYGALASSGYADNIMIDLGLVHKIDYYTGVVFRGYIEGAGEAVLSGGRYDNLVGLFVKNAKISGVGFGFGDVTLENFLVTHKLVPDNLLTNAWMGMQKEPEAENNGEN